MKASHRNRFCLVPLVVAALLSSALPTLGQTTTPRPRVWQAIDENTRVTLKGNVHPLTREALKLGAVSGDKALTRMLLLLKSSPEQETALLDLLEQQQVRNSPNYQKWLTPEQFAQQFGVADADIQAVTAWLRSYGFQIAKVSNGRTVIEFSGTVEQVGQAFRTRIHRYQVNGEDHISNSTDPEIPAALAPVVAGIVSLNDFRPVSHLRLVGTFRRPRGASEAVPLFTPPGSNNFFPLAPGDFAKIYNAAPLLAQTPPIDGTNQTIAIVGESNIHLQDVSDFRNIFGLSQNFTSTNVILDGPDPGINSTEGESDLDIQWAGGVAPGAKIKFITSAPTETTPGIELSALYAVDNNVAAVISESFGQCEQGLGSTGNQFYSALWEQASAQGITVVLSAGDGGSAGCDNFDTQRVATRGLAVSGFASTPFNVAVGGTDFDQVNRWSQFWNQANDPVTQASAKGYIPEIPWNDSCGQLGLTGCANALQGLQNIVAGSGGPSTLYPKPSWQSGAGVPQDGKRDLPDVSLFASNGFDGSIYIICQADVVTPPNPSCNLSNFGFTFQGVGGTSASAPAFAAIMALVNQKLATAQNPSPRQGNANYVLYALARNQVAANLNCASSGPDPNCVFNDVNTGNSFFGEAIGNNSVPCAPGSANCSQTTGGEAGILVDPANKSNPAWTTNSGYDMTTGLGSINVQNLVNNWNSVVSLLSSTTLAATVNGKPVNSISGLTHGQSVGLTATVAPGGGTAGTPSGQVALVATPNPSSGSPSASLGFDSLTLNGGTITETNIVLPGGVYSLTAEYQGDGSFGPSTSNPGIPVDISAEGSKTMISIPVFDPSTGREIANAPTSVVYGSPYFGRVDVGNAQAVLTFPPQASCTPPICPTGTVKLTDSVNGGAPAPLDGGTFVLNTAGFLEDQQIELVGGSHLLSASYLGDGSYGASSNTYSVTVTTASTTTAIDTIDNTPSGTVGVTFNLNLTTHTNSSGVVPTGTYTVFDGGTNVNGTSTIWNGQPGSSKSGAFAQASVKFTFSTPGVHTLTASYSGDSNYASGTSTNSFQVTVTEPTVLTMSTSSTNIIAGNPITLTAIVDTTVKSPTPSHNVQFFGTGDGYFPGTITYTNITDPNGDAALQASLSVMPIRTEQINAIFNGDSNFASSASPVVNVVVVTPDFAINSNSPNLTVPAGQTSQLPIILTPATNLTSAVKLSITNTGMPAGSTFSFVPNPATLSNGQASTVNFSVTLPGPSSNSPAVARSGRRSILLPETLFRWFGMSVAIAIAAMVLLTLPGRRQLKAACVFGLVFLASLAMSCGGGGGSGGGGGGGGGSQLIQTVTMITSSNSKVPFPNSPQFTITVTPASGSATPTGSVTFTDSDLGSQSFPLVNGQAQIQLTAPRVGAHVETASYSGDAQHQVSTSSPFTQIITGSTPVAIQGETGEDAHQIFVTVVVQ